jgi:hypothetical protein
MLILPKHTNPFYPKFRFSGVGIFELSTFGIKKYLHSHLFFICFFDVVAES